MTTLKSERAFKPVIEIIQCNPHQPAWTARVVQMTLPNRRPLTVTIYPDTEGEDNGILINGYLVNWSALGSVDVKSAELYSALIRRAAKEARRLNKKYAGKLMPY